ncbi:Uncharacterized protein FKW44_012631 [Caligus rogercresseyi]|uniref:Reverse transcriptase zinc-binding domain-containing protein n=1 Tax=Caligus rogercresseyi TaxID=217165 RepID=A0A7T8K9P3_CALRO|nr:Uncharacterized protein FKW44_012631 [Caligus rogercresseyi]
MGKVESPTCRLCNDDEETPYHLIYNCPLTRQKMKQLEGNIGEQRLSLEDYIFWDI